MVCPIPRAGFLLGLSALPGEVSAEETPGALRPIWARNGALPHLGVRDGRIEGVQGGVTALHLRTFVSDIHDTALLHGRVCRVGGGLKDLQRGVVWGGWRESLQAP